MKNHRTVTLKRTLCSALSVVIALSSLAFASSLGASAVEADQGKVYYNADYYNENMELVDMIAEELANGSKEVNIYSYGIPRTDLTTLVKTLVRTHPELFYLSTCSAASYQGTLYYIRPVYAYDEEDISEMKEKFEEAVEEYLSNVDDSMTDFEKAVILHDQLVLNCTYDLSGNTYETLVEGIGRCEGYTQAYSVLLSRVGIDSEYVKSDTMNHAWNKIKIDGEFYNVDVTWDDPNPPDYTGLAYHSFFLCSDEAFENDEIMGRRSAEAHTDGTSTLGSDTKYDTAAFHEFGGMMAPYNGGFFAIENYNGASNPKEIVFYDPDEDTVQTILTITDRWDAGNGYYWLDGYTGLAFKDNYLYYNTPNEIMAYDVEDGTITSVAQNPYEEEMYGLILKEDKLYAAITSSPSEERTLVYIADCLIREDPLDLGDVDGDGRVTIKDATLVQRYTAGIMELTDAQLEAADFNEDGAVNIEDVTALQKSVAGMVAETE